jgi:hypothetical protein
MTAFVKSVIGAAAAAASGIVWKSLATPDLEPQHPDDLVVVVTAPGGAARIENAALQGLRQPINDLLNDAAQLAAKRILCRPV